MKISLNWLRDYIDIPKDLDPKQFGMTFTIHTAEVEAVENQAESLDKIVVGKILDIQKHPDADKLQITKTSIGSETFQIVCGDPKIYVGMHVPVALVGAKVHWHGQPEPITLQPTKLRGVESFGMLCAGEEIGLEAKSEGVYDLKQHEHKLQAAGKTLENSLGQPLAEILEQNDIILTIDNKSLTHRPDLWGHYGIAREVAAILGKKLKPFQTSIRYPETGENFSIQVKEKKLCPRYLGVKINNVQIGPSPEWLQQRLQAVGYRSINNIVDATNYVMADLGQPLHAFDANKIEGGIIVQTAKKGEKITTLDGVERELTNSMLVIADHQKPIAIAGVMGGANSEVSNKTTNIVLEAANFHPTSVRKTAAALGFRTEAVQRFEKSLDPHLAEMAMDRLVELILELCPQATIATSKIDIKHFSEKPIQVTVDLKRVFSKIGKIIAQEEVTNILQRLEFKILKETKQKLKVEVPTFRATKDISSEDDLVEEIARMHGYGNIQATLPELPIKLPLENKERKEKHRIREIMALGLGFDEVYNYSFYSLQDLRNALLPEEPHIKVKNYLSEDQTHLRISLVPNLLKNVHENLKHFDEFKIFEIGRTYEDLQEYFPIEEKKLCAMLVKKEKGEKKEKGAITASSYNPEDLFYQAKGTLEVVLNLVHAAGLEGKKGESFCPYAHPNRYLQYISKQNNEEISKLYELHPLVAKNYGLEHVKIAAFEINLSRLSTLPRRATVYKPIPKFPGIEFDVSVVIDKKTEIGRIEDLLRKTDKNLVKKVHLFDVYEGPNLPEGKKALAYKILLQAPDRTLTDQEMKTIQEKVFTELTNLGGDIRGLTK